MQTTLMKRLRNAAVPVALVALAACNGVRADHAEIDAAAPSVTVAPDAAERLAGAVRFATISHADPAAFDSAAFLGLHAHLESAFPRVHRVLEREVIGSYSLLYRWRGSDESLKPILLLGHLDVVPVEPGTEGEWDREPFSGAIADGFIWGRGVIDNKSAIVGTLEAAEMLLAADFRPKRTIYFAYGHDEEVGGVHGARVIADVLRQRGLEFELVLDEGGVVGDGLMRGVGAPTALVGVAEKGFASVELSTTASGGHSSLPPRESPIGILGAAVARLEEQQMPARIEGATSQMFERLGPELSPVQRALFANLWLSRPLVVRKLEQNATTNAMIRTTTAATIFQAGTKENVLASRARAVINFRILPGDSIRDVVQHVREVIADPRVDVRLADSFTAEPSSLTTTDSYAFRNVERTIRSLSPGTIVAPYLVVVVTDARYYAPLSSGVLRFLPVRMEQEDLPRMHGTNERLSIPDYEWAVRFYHQLIMNAAGN